MFVVAWCTDAVWFLSCCQNKLSTLSIPCPKRKSILITTSAFAQSHWCVTSQRCLLQIWLCDEHQNHQELPSRQPEGRCTCVHHVPESHHELPGKTQIQTVVCPSVNRHSAFVKQCREHNNQVRFSRVEQHTCYRHPWIYP